MYLAGNHPGEQMFVGTGKIPKAIHTETSPNGSWYLMYRGVAATYSYGVRSTVEQIECV